MTTQPVLPARALSPDEARQLFLQTLLAACLKVADDQQAAFQQGETVEPDGQKEKVQA